MLMARLNHFITLFFSFFLFCVPQLYLWSSPLGEIIAYVTAFLSNHRGSHIPSSWMAHAGCVFVAAIHPSRTWASGSFRVHAMKCMCAHTRPQFILSSERCSLGMGSEPMLTPREKLPLPEIILLRGGLNPRRCIKQDSKPNTLPNELFWPLFFSFNLDSKLFSCVSITRFKLNFTLSFVTVLSKQTKELIFYPIFFSTAQEISKIFCWQFRVKNWQHVWSKHSYHLSAADIWNAKLSKRNMHDCKSSCIILTYTHKHTHIYLGQHSAYNSTSVRFYRINLSLYKHFWHKIICMCTFKKEASSAKHVQLHQQTKPQLKQQNTSQTNTTDHIPKQKQQTSIWTDHTKDQNSPLSKLSNIVKVYNGLLQTHLQWLWPCERGHTGKPGQWCTYSTSHKHLQQHTDIIWATLSSWVTIT